MIPAAEIEDKIYTSSDLPYKCREQSPEHYVLVLFKKYIGALIGCQILPLLKDIIDFL